MFLHIKPLPNTLPRLSGAFNRLRRASNYLSTIWNFAMQSKWIWSSLCCQTYMSDIINSTIKRYKFVVYIYHIYLSDLLSVTNMTYQ